MTKFKLLSSAISLALLFIFSQNAFSQDIHRFCPNHLGEDYHTKENDFEQRLQKYIQTKKALKKQNLRSSTVNTEEEVYLIPIVVHVVHSNASEKIGGSSLNTNISDEQILSQIEVLNRDFRRNNEDTSNTPDSFKPVAVDTKIQFCLANFDPDGNPTNGITRQYTSKQSYDFYDDNEELKAIDYWPADQYLNLWVTKLDTYQGEQILGYSSFPNDMNTDVKGLPGYEGAATDGVVLDYRFFGNDVGTSQGTLYSYGRTAVHEVGHYLGLLHTFAEPSPSCSYDNDYCADTPMQSNPTDASDLNRACDNILTSCRNEQMYQNYMDYTNDQCMNLFTQDQKDRMRAILEFSPSRNTLLNSAGCCSLNQAYASLPFEEDFANQLKTDSLWNITTGAFNSSWQFETASIPSSAFVLQDETRGVDTTYLMSPLFILNEYEQENQILELKVSYSQPNTSNDLLLSLEYDAGCNENWKSINNLFPNQINNAGKALPYSPTNEELQTFTYSIKDYVTNSYSAIRFRLGQINESNKQVHVSEFSIYPSSSTQKLLFLYPNPTENILNIEFVYEEAQDIKINLYDVTGKEVTQYYIKNTYSNKYELNVSQLSGGFYFIKAEINGSVLTQKFVIQ